MQLIPILLAAWLGVLSSNTLPSQMSETKPAPRVIDWTGDFAALLAGLARNYANFEYTLTDRRVDLAALAARYRAALATAASDAQRRRVFELFLRDLRDPHVSIDWEPRAADTPAPVCPTNLEERTTNSGVAFRRLPEFVALETDDARLFQAGMLRGKGAPAAGVIRIGLFVERAFSPACRAAAAELGLRSDQPCNSACAEQIDRLAAQWLNRALLATVRALEREGAQQLVIDITNNSGGSDWVEIVARMLGGPLRSARIALLKHPVWEAYLDKQVREMEAKVQASSTADRKRLQRAMAVLRAAQTAVAATCDLSEAWLDSELATGRRPLPCTTLVKAEFFASGPEPSSLRPAAPNEVDFLLFSPATYGTFPIGITTLPLVVLVDRNTHSAAEQFAAVLHDNGRATLVGEVTAGAACGTFTRQGTGFVLPSSGARINVPDCVRLRADGSNERRGIAPDRLVPWAPSDSAYQRAGKLADTLRGLR